MGLWCPDLMSAGLWGLRSPGSEARFAVARSVTPKDYKILNHCHRDPISHRKLHLGFIWVGVRAHWSLGRFYPVNNTSPEAVLERWTTPTPSKGPAAATAQPPVITGDVSHTQEMAPRGSEESARKLFIITGEKTAIGQYIKGLFFSPLSTREED